MTKTRILMWADYACATGFANVAGNIARELQKSGRYEIDVVAINYSGDPIDSEKWPGNVYPAMPGVLMNGPYMDVYGRQRVLDLIGTGQYDVVFMIQDTFILRDKEFVDRIVATQKALPKSGMKQFKTVFYYPIDAPTPRDWIDGVVNKIDYPVPYTEYAKAETIKHAPELESQLQPIYHGNNFDDFDYIEDREKVAEFRKTYFGEKAKDKFLIVNVNRNQPRKNVVRNLLLLKELKERGVTNVAMYLHMQHHDAGGNIFIMAEQLGIDDEMLMMPSPHVFNANQGMPFEVLNSIYNSADAVFTPTLGEGWGLSITEAMATKTPVVAPDQTSITEIGANNRAALIPAGNTNNLWTCEQNDNDRVRPLMDISKAADAIIGLKSGNFKTDIEGAYTWVKNLSWENITKQWMQVIDRAAEDSASVIVSGPDDGPQFLSRAQRRKIEREARKKQNANLQIQA